MNLLQLRFNYNKKVAKFLQLFAANGKQEPADLTNNKKENVD
jgi:hypothetical protein